MSVNIFTIVIQILNFLVLVFILNKLIYKPLIKLMKERREYIANSVNDAETKLNNAEALKKEYKQKLNDIEKYKVEQIKNIDLETIKYKNDQLDLIKEEIENEKKQFQIELDNEKSLILENIVKSIFLNVNDFLKEIFIFLSDNTFNDAVLIKFLTEIKNLPNTEIERINNSIKDSVEFISSFNLNNDQKILVENTLKEKNILYKNIKFLEDKKIILGNKIVVNGLVINSNIKDIISQFNTKLEQTI